MRVHIRNIRSFSGYHSIPIKPLTLLVGENSSGKSTFLAILASILNKGKYPSLLGFNTQPYDFGDSTNYISEGGNGTFSVGYSIPNKDSADNIIVNATYKSKGSNVVLTKYRAKCATGKFLIDLQDDGTSEITLFVKDKNEGSVRVKFSGDSKPNLSKDIGEFFLLLLLHMLFDNDVEDEDIIRLKKVAPSIANFASLLSSSERRAVSISPIRSRPRRIYDQFRNIYSPDGEHIPSRLASLLKSNNNRRHEVEEDLRHFGQESGLFEDINILSYSSPSIPPFEVQVVVSGKPRSIADVGYGVSQCLPVVAQSIMESSPIVALMQQPEVHLHPRAQAALGSFFASTVSKHNVNYVIETHSDYLVDRIRLDISKGIIDPQDVSLLYFEKIEGVSHVFCIDIDSSGNIINSPPSYRSFFLKEQINLLSRGK